MTPDRLCWHRWRRCERTIIIIVQLLLCLHYNTVLTATTAVFRQPHCDTAEHLATLWPDCTESTQFCVCTTHAEWVCLPCPRDERFAFEQQMCVPLDEVEEVEERPPEATTTSTTTSETSTATTTQTTDKVADCNAQTSTSWSSMPTAPHRLTTKFVLPTAAERWKIVGRRLGRRRRRRRAHP